MDPLLAPRLGETEVSARLAVFTLGGDTPGTSYGANGLVLSGRKGTLLVDPFIAPAHARLLEELIRARGLPRVTHVVVTHHHTDHALGAGHFAARGAEVVMHEHCATAMRAAHPPLIAERRAHPARATLFADAEPYAPTRTFLERYEVDLGDVVAEARHLGPGHTPGDCVVLFPSERAVACGDLAVCGYHFNYEDADLEGLTAALEGLGSLPVERFLPGHGPAGGAGIVREQARYHRRVARLVRGATSADEARAALRARYPGYQLEAAIESALTRLRAPSRA